MALTDDPTKKKNPAIDQPYIAPSLPVMGALGADANAFRGLAYKRPLSDQVTTGAAGTAVDRFNEAARNAATAGLNLPPPQASAAAPTASTPAPIIATAIAPPAPVFDNTAAGSAGTAVRPAISNDGRTLGYGRTDSNGVRTFGNNDIAAINAKAAGLGRADAGIGGGIGSEAAGGTPVLGAFNGPVGIATPPNPTPNPLAAAQGGNLQAQRFAASDAASIANRDTRSPLGTAARNAAIDAGSSFGTPTSRRLAYGSALENLNGAAASGIKPQADLGIAGVQDAGATQRAGITSAAQLAGDLARNRPNPGAQITLNDGSLGLLGPDGVVRPATDASGKAVKPLQAKDDSATKRSAAIQDQIAKTTAALLGNIVTPGKAATPEQVAQARLTAVQTHGLQTATGPNGQKLVNINGQWQPL